MENCLTRAVLDGLDLCLELPEQKLVLSAALHQLRAIGLQFRQDALPSSHAKLPVPAILPPLIDGQCEKHCESHGYGFQS
ncbi:MAG: hypothetical protein HY704_08860 [Gemmatimonadetes bacterium]|nr:hypothetical protein [Gemmatimonadota bacterium]